MKSLLSVFLGFSMTPVTLGVIFGFAWLGQHYKLSMETVASGIILGFVVMLLAFATFLFLTGRS